MAERQIVFEHVMEPGTGKAVPVFMPPLEA